MDIPSRTQRTAEVLERHLGSCDAVLTTCMERRHPDVMPDEWPLKRMLSLMKMSAQLANTIARLEAQAGHRLAKSEV
jgi:hypothetical protein